ncbi:alkyl hydroperoxide reductase AhpD [Terasakiella brassicae]|uniref:Alkyl hydroperoxide reductase AhpD n=1 Tax=Terasakiella brassicae TaxID=1634917 RepID=A0A917FBU4_9PROT|nr:peroxidase-related enzyme [Terasakiella brassicae]GGF60426.1 alkyl hydroperoxide reductase AhpD [Terasakiella brassicae]
MPQPDHIVKVALPDQTKLDDDIQAYFAKCEEKLGMVPNVLRAFTFNSDKFRTFSKFYNQLMLGDSVLTKLEREMIAVVVSSCNRCYYCLVAHGQAVRELSGDPQLGEMLVMNYRIAKLDKKQRTMLDYAWKLTDTPHDICDEDREALKQAGWGDDAICDITDVTAFFNYTNRMAHGLDMIPNPEYHGQSR